MAEIITKRHISHEGECFYDGDAVRVGGTGRPVVEAVIDHIGETRVWFSSKEGLFPLPVDDIVTLEKQDSLTDVYL